MRRNDFFKYLLFGGRGSASRSELESETLPYTFVSKSQRLRNYRIYGNTVDGESVGDLVETGEHTGEYLVPMTVNDTTTDLYLPEPLKMVGGKAEYVDFREQKQHKVRKNLFNGSEPFSNVDVDTKSQLDIWFRFYSVGSSSQMAAGSAINTQIGQRIIRTVTPREDYERLVVKHNGAAKDIIIISEILEVGKTYVVSFDITSNDIQTVGGVVISKIQIEEGSEATEYEPYIQDTELDVELPTLPTLKGTNTLSVETTVQPSKIWIQGNVSEIPPVSANLNSIPQSLRMIDLSKDKVSEPENEDLQLDIVPVEKYVINLKDSEKTIEPTKVERGVESAE